MTSSSRPKPEAVVRELLLVYWHELLRNRLLDHTIHHRRYSKFPDFAFLLLGYLYPADWVGLVFPLPQLPDKCAPVLSQVGQKFIHLHSIDPTFALVLLHLQVRLIQVVCAKNDFQQVVRLKVSADAVVIRNPPIVRHSCFLSLFRRYHPQVVFDMKLSAVKSVLGCQDLLHLLMWSPFRFTYVCRSCNTAPADFSR